MTANSFLQRLKQHGPAPVYLFLGAESYRRSVCRQALIQEALPEDERESGLDHHDLEAVPLVEVIDDARSLSLFSPRRLIWVRSAEAAIPRGRSAKHSPAEDALAAYVANPSPSVTLVFEASRYELQGDGKKKAGRVVRFYSAIPASQVIEFPPYTPGDALRLAQQLAKRSSLKISSAELALLMEAVGYDASRIAGELDKLQLYVGDQRPVTATDIACMVPSARAATIFELVTALGRGDRGAALGLLDTLVKEGEYLPLALSFLNTQLRHALVAREMGLRTPRQIESHFRAQGIRIWRKKAEEIEATARAFTMAQLRAAVASTHHADKALRDTRPDDRSVMESFVLGLKK